MITFLHGELIEAHPTGVVVGVNGVGYELVIPISSFERLPKKGENVTILTHLHVKEDGMVLYGFMSEEERGLFRLLLGVAGIGPKIAIGILSGISPRNFRAAVSQGSTHVLAVVPGIGKKKAERLIVELKDKIGKLEFVEGRPEGSHHDRLVDDAARALLALGYSHSEAQKSIQAALQRIGAPEDVEKLIREALKSA
ncbi:MAG: Holliday junction branch migration protein RuvA [bacterium]|jgi:Holliday junction DNA helicase RuvA